MERARVLAGCLTLLALAASCGRDAPAPPGRDPRAGSPGRELAAGAGDAMEKATFGAGCFWGVEETFRQVPGVTATRVGYMGGTVENPTYREVCTDRTGHAEVCEVTFDPAATGYGKLLEVFWGVHDPTQVNRQGPDVGRQYRSVIFYHSDEQRLVAEKSRADLAASGKFSRPIATAVEPAAAFWPAEEYHQRYLQKQGGGSCHLPAK